MGSLKALKPKLEDDITKSSRMSDPEELTFQGVFAAVNLVDSKLTWQIYGRRWLQDRAIR
jgi:hypothetical protein